MELVDDFSFCRPYISAGEAVLWKGKPEKGHLFTSQDVLMIPFSIAWCGFAIFWETSVIASGAPFFFKLWGIPFVCVGLYLVFGRFIWSAWIRKRTAYVVTNKKIIRARGNRIDMLEGRNMPAMHVDARRDGTGTIRFGAEWGYYRGGRRNTYPNEQAFALENIADVARVQQIISNMEH